MFTSNIEMVVYLQFYPIIDEHPDQTINPDHADVNPRNRGHQKAKTHDHGCNRLGKQDGEEKDLCRVRLAEERMPGAGNK